jgi:hypothetical protein
MTTQQQQPKGERGKRSMFANWWGWLVVTWSAKGHALPTPPLLRTLSRTSNALSFTRAPQPPRTTSRGKGLLLLLLLRLLQSPPHTLLLRTSHPRLLFPRSPTFPRTLVRLSIMRFYCFISLSTTEKQKKICRETAPKIILVSSPRLQFPISLSA